MAKNNNKFRKAMFWISVIGISLTLAGVIWAGAKGYGKVTEKQETIVKDAGTLKTEGCEPAREHEVEIAVIDTKLESIQIEQKAMRTDFNTGKDEILKAIREK